MSQAKIAAVAAGDRDGALAALEVDGVVIIEDLFDAEAVGQVRADLSGELGSQEPGGGVFYGKRAKRVSRVLALSPTARDMAANDALMHVAQGVLGPYCLNYRLQLLSALEVWGGGELQPLHRDAGVYEPFLPVPGPHEYMISVMLAGTDFTKENGATRLAPGSHRWEKNRKAEEHEIAQAVMRRGSVAIWLGSLLHGMGVNTTDRARLGVVWGYVLGWLRQEQEAMLVLPPDVARTLPESQRRLIGYQSHGPLLGWVGGNEASPHAADDPNAGSKLLV